ncbi:MAG: cytochrome c [Rouxiella badensis]
MPTNYSLTRKMPFRRAFYFAGIAAAALMGSAVSHAAESLPLAAPSDHQTGADLIARGQYLAIAADCAACHTDPSSKKVFAGGYAIHSPMGIIYSSNITPSKGFGIGNYTEKQFSDAVRQGIRADGSHLYPAMPYPSYAGLTDADIHALYAYFMHGVKPIDEKPQQTKLSFPFNLRFSMAGWNLLFLHNKPFTPVESEDATWNRGKYLVDNVEHCSECHTPRNALMALQGGNALYTGAMLGSWHAPNLTSDAVSGLGGWSDKDLAQYLQTGHVNGKAQAAGPMAEAVTNSLQYLHDDDIKAIIAYLRILPPVRDPSQTQAASEFGTGSNSDTATRGIHPISKFLSAEASGQTLYDASCSSCHQPDGKGTHDGFYPSLVHNTTLGGDSPDNLVSTILFGVQRTVNGKSVLMPAFGPYSDVQALSDKQVATLSNYLFKQYGNPQLSVTEEDVKTIRQGGATPLIARVAGPATLAGGVIVVILVVLLAVWRLRRKRR